MKEISMSCVLLATLACRLFLIKAS
jgi:hypothetical protein